MKGKILIVGAGIAGMSLALALRRRKHDFLLIDNPQSNTSSRIAAGMFNAVSGKRMTVSAQAENMLAELHQCIQETEQESRQTLLVQANIIQAFGNVKEGNDFAAQAADAAFSQYTRWPVQTPASLQAPHGCFMIEKSGWVKTGQWLDTCMQQLKAEGLYIENMVDYKNLKGMNGVWEYEGIPYAAVVFCEGYRYTENPWFSWLPFKLCKGQVLLIRCKGLDPGIILKKGVYLVHQYDDVYKVGATYEWEFEDSLPNEAGLNMLKEKLDALLTLPYEILDHYAGIRPTTRDRNPMLGKHPEADGLYVMNGLGTKGMLQGPYLAACMADFLMQQQELPATVNINRYLSYYKRPHD